MSETTSPPAPRQYSGIPVESRRSWLVPRRLKEGFVALALIALASLATSKFITLVNGRLERVKAAVEAQDVDGPARPIVLPRRGGGAYDLASSRGKIVLVNFWATWCGPCREEMPSLARLSQLMDPATFQLVAVSVDDGWAPIETFFEQRPTPYPVVLDRGAKVSLAYGTSKFPETFLIDGQGNVKLKFVGARNWSEDRIVALLEELGAKRAVRSSGPEPKAHAGAGG